MTFSIVGCDTTTGEVGVAVQSKFIAVGSVVPWARAGIGAVATQSLANTTYGPEGLRLLSEGLAPRDVIERLAAADARRADRQVGVVDAQGHAATYTGEDCTAWAGGRVGDGYAAQGNILVSAATVDAMAETFEVTRGSLTDRLLTALEAGQEAGGDRRGQQAAALLVVREGAGYGGYNDRYLDLRVDEHPTPIAELRRIVELYTLYFPPAGPRELVPIDAPLAHELRTILTRTGDYTGTATGEGDTSANAGLDEATRAALTAYMGRENLEERGAEGDAIDAVVLRYMRAPR